jgi:fructosamine-3-kinase
MEGQRAVDTTSSFARALAATLGGRWAVQRLQASGFCATWRVRSSAQTLFVKSLPLAQGETLRAEADGLAAIGSVGAIRVPAVAGCWRDVDLGAAVLALEWLELVEPDRDFGARFGRALAELHRAQPPEGGGRFGWRRDNRIGATPQRNRWSKGTTLADWIEFFRVERLEVMRDRLARTEPALAEAVAAVVAVLPHFFADGYVPRASLIHGDLWSGNWGMLSDGTPVIYDPAVSCSDAEAELAMMELFGQPPAGFRTAYDGVVARHDGYRRRRGLYQLYHLLNHAVLFGGGYVRQAQDLARNLCAEA